MLLRKRLPPIREPRLYLSMERSYLSLIKILIIAFGSGLLARKFIFALDMFHLYRLIPLFRDLYTALTWPAIIGTLAILPLFWSDLRYLRHAPQVQAKEMADPRVSFSAERTFLSWTRTAMSSVALAFVLAKFDFFLERFAQYAHHPIPLIHHLAGSDNLFLVFGLLTLGGGGWGYYSTLRDVRQGNCRSHDRLYSAYGIVLFALASGMAYLVLLLDGYH